MKEAKLIIEEYGLSTDEETFEIVLEVIQKFGTARNVIIEGLKPEYKYLKKLSKLVAMLDEKQTYELEAEKIATLMHDINKVVSRDSESKGEDFLSLMNRINIRESFHPTDMQLWVMNFLGGRELLAKVNLQESNQLLRRITNAIEKYQRTPELSSTLAIENSALNNLQIKN